MSCMLRREERNVEGEPLLSYLFSPECGISVLRQGILPQSQERLDNLFVVRLQILLFADLSLRCECLFDSLE
jgi:hypothetical protein